MLVIDEEEVSHIVNSIAYLDQAIENFETYLDRVQADLPKRINKDDLIETFRKFGLFHSYTLREAIVGKLRAPKVLTQSELRKVMPTPSPPKRAADFGKRQTEISATP